VLGIKIKKNHQFIGRRRELDKLVKIDRNDGAKSIFVYGRRRVGKTELIEQFFRDRNVLKFEGLQVDLKKKIDFQKDQSRQIQECLRRLAIYSSEPAIPTEVNNWSEFFELLKTRVSDGDVLYFEEGHTITK